MIRLSSAPSIPKEDEQALVDARASLTKALKTRELSATANRRGRSAVAAISYVLNADRPRAKDFRRVAILMKRIATDTEIYPIEQRQERTKEQLDRMHSSVDTSVSMMPTMESGGTVEVGHVYRDEPQNTAGLTRSPLDPTRVAEEIMVKQDRSVYREIQDGFNGYVQEGGPYHNASFDQKLRLAKILRSYGYHIVFNEAETWGLDNKRRKSNENPEFQKAKPQSDIKDVRAQKDSKRDKSGKEDHEDCPEKKEEKKDIRTKLPPYMTPKSKKKKKKKRGQEYSGGHPDAGDTDDSGSIAIPGGPPGSSPSAGGGAAAVKLCIRK